MKDADGEEIPPIAFFELAKHGPDEPAEIASRLFVECEEFADLRAGEPLILFLMRRAPKVKTGKWVLGEMCLPRFMGGLAPVCSWLLAKATGGHIPDFLLLLDAGWWGAAKPLERKALIHHELKHIGIAIDREGERKFDEDGRPQWTLMPHDLEEFNDTVRRFGAWSMDIRGFQSALREHGG